MTTVVQQRRYFERRATAAAWAAANPILGNGEIGVDLTNNQIRVGDGVKRWNQIMPLGVVDEAMVTSIATAAGELAVEQYLEENPPATAIVATPHPTFPGVVVLAAGAAQPNPGAPKISDLDTLGYSASPDFTLGLTLAADPLPTNDQVVFETNANNQGWVVRTATLNTGTVPVAGYNEWVITALVPAPALSFKVRITITTSAGTAVVVADVPH